MSNLLRSKLDLTPTHIHFWRTRDQAEVDFVLETGLEVIPIEVKYSKIKKPELPRSLRSFLAKYKPKKAYMVHLGERFETELEGVKVYTLPFFDLIGWKETS